MQQAGQGLGQPPPQLQSGVHILLQHEADEAGEEDRRPRRDRELQHIAQRDAEGSAPQVSSQRRLRQLHRRPPEAEILQREDRPAGDGEPAQQAVGSPLEERAVALDHPEDAQRPHAQGERHQAVGDPDARVEHQRQVPVSQDARAEEQTQTHVPGGAHHEGGGKGDEHDAGGRA